METLQSIIVYSLLTFLMWRLCRKYARVGKWSSVVAACVIYTIVFGFRYGVGMDYFAYGSAYKELLVWGTNNFFETREVGFYLLAKLLAILEVPEVGFFIATSFLPIYFTFLSIRPDRIVLPFVLLSFMLTAVWLTYTNSLRQVLSYSLFLCAISSISRQSAYAPGNNFTVPVRRHFRYQPYYPRFELLRSFLSSFIKRQKAFFGDGLNYYLIVLAAILFHNSAWLLLIFYPLLTKYKEWFHSIPKQLFFLGVSLCLMRMGIVNIFMNLIETVMYLSGYVFYAEERHEELFNGEYVPLGIGFFINLSRDITIILFSNKIKRWSSNDFFTMVYNLFYVGLIAQYIFWGSHLVNRQFMYCYMMSFVAGGYLLAYLYHMRRRMYRPVLFLLFCSTFFACILRGGENTATYVMQGQESLYRIKDKVLNRDAD